MKMNGQATDARLMVEAQARTIDDLRQQLSFLRQAMQDAEVEQWSKEHPRKTKTRQDVFLSVYPNAKMNKRSRTVDVSPCFVDKSWSANGCPNNDCAVCRRQFWMQEAE